LMVTGVSIKKGESFHNPKWSQLFDQRVIKGRDV
jgi:hypothetical protein